MATLPPIFDNSRARRALLGGLFSILGAACGGPVDADAGIDAACLTMSCDDGLYCNGLERCEPGAPGADSSGCVAGEPPCSGEQWCDEASQMCRPPCPDADGDGARDAECGGLDCDDRDPNRFPDNPEVCDGADNNCRGGIDEGLHVARFSMSWESASALDPRCAPGEDAACAFAIHGFCSGAEPAEGACQPSTGFGIAAYDETNVELYCLDVPAMEVEWAELAAKGHACSETERSDASCHLAAHEVCVERGFATGWGPLVDIADDPSTQIVCLASHQSTLSKLPWEELTALVAECEEGGARVACQRAITSWCDARGYRGGFGPLGTEDGEALFACVRNY